MCPQVTHKNFPLAILWGANCRKQFKDELRKGKQEQEEKGMRNINESPLLEPDHHQHNGEIIERDFIWV